MSAASSPKHTPTMLLASSHYGHGHNHNIKTPKHGSPHMVTMGLSGGATTMPSSSSSLIIDNQGQAHDPGYLDALRQLHAKIGEDAMGNGRKSDGKRRQSSTHAPVRPSALGLGLASNMANMDLHSDSSDDDDDDEDLDSYASLFEDAKKKDAEIQRRNSMAAYSAAQSAYNSPNLRPINHTGNSPLSTPTFTGNGHISPRRGSQTLSGSSPQYLQNSHLSSSSSGLTPPSATTIGGRKGSISNGVNSLGVSLRSKSPSLRKKLSNVTTPRKASSRSRPSSSSSAHQPFGSGSIQGAPSTLDTLNSGVLERPREYITSDNDRNGLSTIESGRLLGTDDMLLKPASSHDSRSESDSQTSLRKTSVAQSLPGSRTSMSSLTRDKLEAELQQQQEEADFLVEPSHLKEGLNSIRKKGHELGDLGTQTHDFRRKMDIFTMGLRFNAFKAKRKLERGFKHHET
jgi:hypothetical protein